MVLQGESISGKGNSTCKGPELAVCLAHSWNSKEAVAVVGHVSEGVKAEGEAGEGRAEPGFYAEMVACTGR